MSYNVLECTRHWISGSFKGSLLKLRVLGWPLEIFTFKSTVCRGRVPLLILIECDIYQTYAAIIPYVKFALNIKAIFSRYMVMDLEFFIASATCNQVII